MAQSLAAPLEDADVHTASDEYARRFAGAVGAWFLDVQARITLDLLKAWPGARVLDVGGGHAQLTGPLIEAGYDVTVHGTAESCAQRLRSWLEAGRVRFGTGPLLGLPWPDRSFDVVVAFRLLPHVTAWSALTSELARVARHAVVFDYPTQRSVNVVSDAFFGAKKGLEGNTRPFRVFTEAEIDGAVQAAGLRTTARRPEFLLPMALHRALGSAPLSRAFEAPAAAFGLTSWLGSPVVRRAERTS
jgi:2-polyprenyl-3-methyl-5-hydroxy-6-metoxy-1,4-benzoquinol methylase